MQPGELHIDPRDFIMGPFIECPACRAASTYGVLSVNKDHFIRRCRACWHTTIYPLPDLKKKVVYLDQFVISEIMKTLNPQAAAHKRAREDRRWLDLFRKLDRLVKLQVIVCPSSIFHFEESSVSPFLPALRRMYEFLSVGCSFEDYEVIIRRQLYAHVQAWVQGNPSAIRLDPEDVVNGSLHGWRPRLGITLNLRLTPQMIQELIESKGARHEGFAKVFKRWQKEPRGFTDRFREEWMAFGPIIYKCFIAEMTRQRGIAEGQAVLTPDDIWPRPAYLQVKVILRGLEKAGVSADTCAAKALEYLHSPILEFLPYNRVSAALFASVAVKAGAGQKRPPGPSFPTDVDIVGSLLPYCDAMLVDKYVHALLQEAPAREILRDYPCALFSVRTLDGLGDYLAGLERQASPDHLSRVREVYGEKWGEPFENLFTHKSAGRG